MKKTKLMREVAGIIDDPDMHFWIKCKHLTKTKTYGRPGSYIAETMIRDFFKTCAGRLKERFDSAYVRPYLNSWDDSRRQYDYVNGKELNDDSSNKIGRLPRGVLTNAPLKRDMITSQERFCAYIRAKFPDAFEEFEEIKKVDYHYGHGSAMEKTSDCAWEHVFPHAVRSCRYPLPSSDSSKRSSWHPEKTEQEKRRTLDLAMEKAQADYNALKKASGLPPRYLYNEVSLAELQDNHRNHTYAIFNGHYITTDTVLHYDDSKVAFGLGKLASTDRSIIIRGKGGPDITWKLKAYRGNFVLNAIEERFGRVEKIAYNTDALPFIRPLQLNPKMEVTEIAKSNGFRIFKRLFSGAHYDYCVLKKGITYHGESIKKCIAGWEKKKRILKPGATILNMRMLKEEFGFCNDGIRSFCLTNHLDSKDNYTVEEIKVVVGKKLPYNKAYYGRELKQLGIF